MIPTKGRSKLQSRQLRAEFDNVDRKGLDENNRSSDQRAKYTQRKTAETPNAPVWYVCACAPEAILLNGKVVHAR